jgi:hypothetical protein
MQTITPECYTYTEKLIQKIQQIWFHRKFKIMVVWNFVSTFNFSPSELNNDKWTWQMRNLKKISVCVCVCVCHRHYTILQSLLWNKRISEAFYTKYKKEQLVCRPCLSVCDLISKTKQFIGFYQFGRNVLYKIINQTWFSWQKSQRESQIS